MKVIRSKWKEFIENKKFNDDFRDDDEYSFAEFMNWLD